ncbi:mediator of RNA polymerase II transcription subunit 23 isoform X1 [Danaus plexippus]|uniref:Mediator of RNA polymerase II transcription subunit 23 n=1 Tax=Danaus plexippus plexippus TaxID=278856 RepID=A0A212EZE8_DANPL|nr:mediator of RNA polymerase II transcription subunit 23 isoform X1 [Danaus plexippus]OWR46814.1 mediator of RNA polymerase 2 transcription subunit 23 like protein [Danaus plexippus plexippus]
MTDSQVANIVNEILRVEAVEEAFSCFLVYKPEQESERLSIYQKKLCSIMSSPSAEVQESAIRQYLTLTAVLTNRYKMKQLLGLLENLVNTNILQARMLCDCILTSEKLVYKNSDYWIECFNLVRRVIGGVDYKGVREIMKGCREKAQTLPVRLNSSTMPQMRALCNVIEYIFDRNASLLPAYFIVTEIQKDYPDNNHWPHWQLAKLLTTFVESFKPCAQMVSIIGHSQMLPVVEFSGYADHLVNPWRLDPTTLKFSLKGNLPYDDELLKPQISLLRHVLQQPYSRDMMCSMLGLQKQHKQRCIALEDQLVELMILPMERSEQENEDDEMPSTHWCWLHLSSQVIYLILIGFASFPSIVMGLHNKLVGCDLKKGRDHLMWVLLQFISGSIQRNPLSNFLPIIKLHELLYPEKEALPMPDYTKAHCTHQMAVVCIWMHLLKKAESEHKTMIMPQNLKVQYEFLQHLMTSNNTPTLMGADYRIALLCNAYSTNQEYYARPMGIIIETLFGNQKPMPNGNPAAPLPTVPLSMCILDSLTLHCKMSLIHSIVTHVAKLAQNKTTIPGSNMMAPALVETYSRLLVYTEIESLGIKGFINQLLPNVFKSHAWGILHNLLDMFSYRIHHIQPHYRVTLLSNINSLAAYPQANQTQLQLCFESTALRLITSLGSSGVQLQMSRVVSEPKSCVVVSSESEELNRVLVLTLARGIYMTGTGNDGAAVKEILTTIMTNTPHMWSQHTLQCFPPVLVEFFSQNPAPKENKQLLKKSVEEEYRKWTSMANDNDIISHFSVPGTPLFLCLLWKMIFETNRINPIAFKILERIGARALSAHLRKFCDYLVFEVTNPAGGPHINKCVDAINDIIWKYNIVTIDRLVLCLVLRPNPDGNESQVCLYIIQLLLLKGSELRNRAQDFVKENSPEHWKQNNWYERHSAFHRKYPEKFAPEETSGAYGGPIPVYLSNVCLRFIPVLDIVVHRHLEIPQVSKNLEQLLEHLGYLYKFHDRPVTFLYNTLHYYESKLRDKPLLKRKLVTAVLGSLKEVRAPGWATTEAFQTFLGSETEAWSPDLNYYLSLINRMVDTMMGSSHFPNTDWRFNEYPNPSAHCLYVTCVELMSLPVPPNTVGNNLLDVVTKGFVVIPANKIQLWINAIGIIMAALPDPYWTVVHDRLLELITGTEMVEWTYQHTPFQLFNLTKTNECMLENKYSLTLALAHAVWYHAGPGQIMQVPTFVKEKMSPEIRTEVQLIFLCHLMGPYLQRFNTDLSRAVMDITIVLYELLAHIDKSQTHLQYIDPICDLLYHIKYMFVGDTMKNEVENVIRKLRPALQMRLRFITHLNVEQINTA